MFWSHWRPRHCSQHHQCDLFPRVWFILTQPLGPTLALLQTKAHSAFLRQPERAQQRHHNSWSICLAAGGPSFIPGTAVPQAPPREMPEHAQEPGIASSTPLTTLEKKKYITFLETELSQTLEIEHFPKPGLLLGGGIRYRKKQESGSKAKRMSTP